MRFRDFEYIVSRTMKSYKFNSRQHVLLIIFFTLSNFLLGFFVISYTASFTEHKRITTQIDPIEGSAISVPTRRPIKQYYNHYLRIDFKTNQTGCRPSDMFNTSPTIASMQNLTNFKLNKLFAPHLSINIDIISVNLVLKKTYKSKSSFTNKVARKTVCNYVLELYVGLDFSSNCNISCQSKELQRLTSNIQPFGDPLDRSFIFFIYPLDSMETNIEFHIDQIYVYRSSKYYNRSVYIRSFYDDFYVSALILDPDAHQTSITMGKIDRSLFIIKDGLYKNPIKNDSAPIYVSLLMDKTYLRHEKGRIKLGKNDQSDLFKQDATFRLITSQNGENIVGFQPINIPQLYMAVDSEINRFLILDKPKDKHETIDRFDKRFLFELKDKS